MKPLVQVGDDILLKVTDVKEDEYKFGNFRIVYFDPAEGKFCFAVLEPEDPTSGLLWMDKYGDFVIPGAAFTAINVRLTRLGQVIYSNDAEVKLYAESLPVHH